MCRQREVHVHLGLELSARKNGHWLQAELLETGRLIQAGCLHIALRNREREYFHLGVGACVPDCGVEKRSRST